MVIMILKSHAKINLFLEITGKKDGLHILHSLFSCINIYDEIAIRKSETLKITYGNTQVEDDIILKAISVLRKHFCDVDANFIIDVKKNIPIGAGLGGGSSNAAEVLKFLIAYNKIDVSCERLLEIAFEIGSDVPFFILKKPMVLNGTGKEISSPPFQILPLFCVVAYGNFSLLTKDVFAQIKPPYSIFEPVHSFNEAIIRRNDMQETANVLTNGLISRTIHAISHGKSMATRMSGSGIACFSLFGEESHAQECLKNAVKFKEINAFLTHLV